MWLLIGDGEMIALEEWPSFFTDKISEMSIELSKKRISIENEVVEKILKHFDKEEIELEIYPQHDGFERYKLVHKSSGLMLVLLTWWTGYRWDKSGTVLTKSIGYNVHYEDENIESLGRNISEN
jgi:hypothetical protein